MKVQFSRKFLEELRGKVERYNFEVGILEDAPHYAAKPLSAGLKSYAGGKARKTSRKTTGEKLSEVSASFRAFLGFNYLVAPFKQKNSDILKFTSAFLKFAFDKSDDKRVRNLIQAIVRNPILRKDYGSNTKQTQKRKGFDRLGIDTAQLFKGITARVVRARKRSV